MGLPDPKQFNFKLLLQRLQKKYGEEMTREYLSQLLHDEIIKGEPIRHKSKRGGNFVTGWKDREPAYYVDGPIYDYVVPLAEVLRFEAENPPGPIPPEPATTTNKNETPPPLDFTKILVARAAWEVYKETGKMHIDEVLKRLRRIVKTEDQARAIITHVDLTNGITIIGRDEPIAKKTIVNWLTPLRAEAKQKSLQ